MSEFLLEQFNRAFEQLSGVDTRLVAYVALLVAVVIALENILFALKRVRKSTGLSTSRERAISIDGAKNHPARTYVSEVQGLAGRPDAVIIERGQFIPVERKPLTNKVRDRYIAQLLVYMRLIEEFEGKRPPYGYLIVGKNARKVTIQNTEERQKWLSEHLIKMREIVEQGAPPVPDPHPKKCARCKVRESCDARGDQSDNLVKLRPGFKG